MNKYRITAILALFVTLVLSGSCSEDKHTNTSSTPTDLTRDKVCILDGMILLDHPGPKGQIILKNNEQHFFCDTKGLISTLYDENYKAKIKQAFVQDFGNRKWGSYKDNWIDIKHAFLVIDSNQLGAMGPTPATFGARSDADNFAQKFGGIVLPFTSFDEGKFEAYQKRIRQKLRDTMGNNLVSD